MCQFKFTLKQFLKKLYKYNIQFYLIMISTKIIATIGPASDSEQKIQEMYNAGMRVARLNFSHGNYEYFKKVISNIRKVNDEIAIMLDTKGPEIRSGELEGGEIELFDNDKLTLTKKQIIGNKSKITVNYTHLEQLKKGDKVLIDDGLIECEVISSENQEVIVKVLNGGKLGSKKTVSLRGHNAKIAFLSKKDKEDIQFAIDNDLDFIAASFVRTAKDVRDIRYMLEKQKSIIRVISKIEHWEALENIDEIIEVSQGVMVARGDLAVEIPMEKVPKIQSQIIKHCNEMGKPVIVATQMLESMKSNPRPTRAEVSDVARAILEGADAIMLSGETASGKYPIKAVKMMGEIAKEYDKDVKNTILDNKHSEKELKLNSVSMFVTKAAFLASEALNTAAILTPTESGFTARKVSRFKPRCPIYASTHSKTVMRQLQLSWGVYPMFTKKHYVNLDEMINENITEIYNKKLVKKSDKVVITAGHKLAEAGHTNIMEIYKVEVVIDNLKRGKI